MSFDWRKPTVQMLGRWQPWHDGHTALFKQSLAITGQVCIMVRDVEGWGDDNPFDFHFVWKNIKEGLAQHGYQEGIEYEIIHVPNIVNISYGRGVGYTFMKHDLGEEVHSISATKIRAKMREEGEL